MRHKKHCLLALILASMQVPILKHLANDTGDGQPESKPAPQSFVMKQHPLARLKRGTGLWTAWSVTGRSLRSLRQQMLMASILPNPLLNVSCELLACEWQPQC
jgi:hypothetical protein